MVCWRIVINISRICFPRWRSNDGQEDCIQHVQYIAAYQQDTVMATQQSLIAAWHEHHGTLGRADAWNWSLHENYCSNIDLRWQAYTIVFDYHERQCSTIQWWRLCIKHTFACCRGECECVTVAWLPPGEMYPPAHPPRKPPLYTLLPPPEWYNAWKSSGNTWNTDC